MKRTIVCSVIAVPASVRGVLLAILFTGLAVAAPVTRTSATKPSAAAMSRVVEAFSDFAGSPPNAQSLLEGLYRGTRIELDDRNNVATTFTPVTKAMNWDDVKIALSLARAELGSADITNPAPADIEAVLNGGTAGTGDLMINFTGVLTQRASGLGWDQIAKAHNFGLEMLVNGASSPAAQSAGDARVGTMSPVSTANPANKRPKRQP